MVLEQYIQRVEEKLQLLVKRLHYVQSENASLKEEVTQQQQALQQQQLTIQAMEDKLHLSKIAATAQGGATATEDAAFKKEIRNKINEYIKEIDRCIALLNG